MEFAFTEDQLAIKDSVAKLCAQFDDKYWLKKDKEGGFPNDFYKAMADAGWLGIAMPEEYGGAGLGIHPPAQWTRVGLTRGGAVESSDDRIGHGGQRDLGDPKRKPEDPGCHCNARDRPAGAERHCCR